MDDGSGGVYDGGSNSKQLHLRIFQRWGTLEACETVRAECRCNQSGPRLMLQQQCQPLPSCSFACLSPQSHLSLSLSLSLSLTLFPVPPISRPVYYPVRRLAAASSCCSRAN